MWNELCYYVAPMFKGILSELEKKVKQDWEGQKMERWEWKTLNDGAKMRNMQEHFFFGIFS